MKELKPNRIAQPKQLRENKNQKQFEHEHNKHNNRK